MIKLKSLLNWLDQHILILLAGFLLAFIPLYPKLPLFEAIPGYIVRVRLEDIFIFLTAVIWFIQVLRKKVAWKTPVLWVMAAYAVAGLLSSISAIVITQTVPPHTLHVAKTFLHYFRYLEYFSLFAILYSAITTTKQVKILLGVLVATMVAISIYGYGQKMWYWPVYSTMNREFSKGLRLYLTDHARVQSTFGGHYDLAAYLVITLPVILALAFMVKRRLFKVALHGVHLAGVWLLIVSASRTSFIGYILAASIVVALFALNKTTWKERLVWGSTRLAFVGIVTLTMLVTFGDDMYERLIQVLKGYPQVYDQYVMLDKQREKFFEDTLPSALGLKHLALQLPTAKVPDNAISTQEAEAMEQDNTLVPSDQRPVTERPTDVYVDVPEYVEVATISASGTATTVIEERERVFSECALQKSLSLCIRTETLWPRAVAGFYRNPLLGSGYATLTKETTSQFTEAESTDNNFLRTLGETGLAGFVTFYGSMALALWLIRRHLFSKDALGRTLSIALVAGTVGLLLNAVYIDVFAASKVALTYWALVGLVLGYFHVRRQEAATPVVATSTHTAKVKSTKAAKKKKSR